MPRNDTPPRPEAWFPEGASRYLDSHPGFAEAQPRIYVKFRPEGVDTLFWALLDTGAHFFLLNETVAGFLRDHLGDSLGSFTVRTAYGPVEGELYRHRVTLAAEVGESLDIDATVFLPPGWQGPCFLGYAGVLERARFGVDPGENRFSFGLSRA